MAGDISVQILTFNSVPSKIFFGKIDPHQPPPHGDWGLADMTFLCTSGHFIQFVGKKISLVI